MAKQKEAWDKLSMQEKAQLIKLSIDNGVSSLKQIRDAYNLYANGSNLAHKKSGEEEGENQDLNYIQQRDDFKGNFITKLVPRQWGRHGDLSRYYFGQPTQDNALVYSQFKPSKSNNSSAKYIAIALPKFKDYIVDAYFQHPEYFVDDKHYNGNLYSSFANKNPKLNNYDLNNLGTFTLGKGRDERGDYLSYYDIWDTDTSKQSNPDLQKEYLGAAKPFEVYDRIYLDDYYNVPNTEKGTIFLPEITVTPNINKKSTGGPLYPFSFEKNPFLKTPVVRYDEGGFFARLFGKKDTPPTPEEIKADRVERFINDTWETEYSVPKGYDPVTGLYFPYDSPEGGTKTIGPGFKLREDGSGDATMFTAKEAARGVTREQINKKLRAQGELQYDKVLEFLNQKGNRLPVDTINPNIMNGLMDLRFQVGTLGGWNNLREAVLNGDLEGIKKESKVTFKNEKTGKIKVDTRRNDLRAEKFWHYD